MKTKSEILDIAKNKYKKKYQDKFGQIIDKIDGIDLTEEYCQIALELNPEFLKSCDIKTLIDWVIDKSDNKCNDKIIIYDCFLSEFEERAFSYQEQES